MTHPYKTRVLVKYTDYEELETLAGEHFSDADKKKK